MKRFLLAGVAMVALIGMARAADLAVRKPPPVAVPPPPPFSWTGCFIGVHGGWGWGRKNVDEAEHFRSFFFDFDATGSGRVDTSGALFGGQVGCDYQLRYGVIGIQGDIAAADINGFNRDPFDPNDPTEVLRAKQDAIASVTGRIGWAGWQQTLWYFKGGAAWSHDRWDLSASDINQEPFFADFGTSVVNQSRSGWTVGAGVEWAFLPNWSAFVEWDHYDFGRKNLVSNTGCFINCSFVSDEVLMHVKQRLETVKIGVNYRF
jgi:outer membrane immunogenic protein